VEYWKEGVERILRSTEPGLDREQRDVRTLQTVIHLILAHMDQEMEGSPGFPPPPEEENISQLPSPSITKIEEEQLLRLSTHEFEGPSLLFCLIPPEMYSRVFSIALDEKEHRKPKKKKIPYHEPETVSNPPEAVAGLAAGMLSWELREQCCRKDPVRVLDPFCRTGKFLLDLCAMIPCSQGGTPRTGAEPGRQDSWPGILLYGMDPDPVMLECTKFVLFLHHKGVLGSDTCDQPGLLHRYRNTEALAGISLVRGNAIIGTDILTDLFRAEPASSRELRLSPLDWETQFPWLNETGFDGVGGQLLFSPDRLSRTVRDYLAQRYRAYRPAAGLEDCYLERILELLKDGGIYSALLPGTWLSAASDADARRLVAESAILAILEYGPDRSGAPSRRGEGFCIITGGNAPQARFVRVLHASTGRVPGPLVTRVEEIPAPAGRGGWNLKDPRLGELRSLVANHGAPLARYLLGEIYQGTLPPGFRKDPPCSPPDIRHPGSKQPYIRGSSVVPYIPAVPDGYLQVQEPVGMPCPTGQICEPGIQPGISSHETGMAGELVIAIRPGSLRATIGPRLMHYDREILHAPHPDLYLVGVINSTVARFIMRFDDEKKPGRPGETRVSRALGFPVHVIDTASPEESRIGERIRMLVERMFLLAPLAGTGGRDVSDKLDIRIKHTGGAIDSLVCRLYGIDPARKNVMDDYLEGVKGPR